MGDWRTVQLVGKVADKSEVEGIIKYLKVDKNSYDSLAYDDGVYYLQFGSSLCGINQWVNSNGKISVIGNVYERDCELDDLEKELNVIAKKYNSLDLVLHAGGSYESTECTASFIVKNGIVKRCEPMVKEIDKISKDRIQSNLFKALGMW